MNHIDLVLLVALVAFGWGRPGAQAEGHALGMQISFLLSNSYFQIK